MASQQFKVFRERIDDLVEGVQLDLDRIARRAFGRNLISHSTYQTVNDSKTDITQRATCLVSAIHLQIKLREETFTEFLSILREEPSLRAFADTLVRDWRQKSAPGMEDEVSSSCGTSMGGATAMDLDSGVADTSALSEVIDGDMMPPGEELVNVRNSSPPVDGGADQSDSDTRQRNSTYGQEVRQGSGADSLVTTPHGPIPRAGSSASLSTLDDKYNTRMELAQKVAAISVREAQVQDLKRTLVDAEREYQKVGREKSEIAAELQKVTKEKDKEIEHLKEEVQNKEKQVSAYQQEISAYQQQIAELQRESAKFKEENAKTKKEYEEKLKELQESLKEAQESLRQKDVEYHKEVREWEQKIHALKLQHAEKDVKLAEYRTELAELKLREEQEQRRKSEFEAEKKRQESEAEAERRLHEEQKKRQDSEAEAERKLREEQKKRRDSEAEAERKIREEQKKRRDSYAELEKLRGKVAQRKVAQKRTDIPEDDADNPWRDVLVIVLFLLISILASWLVFH